VAGLAPLLVFIVAPPIFGLLLALEWNLSAIEGFALVLCMTMMGRVFSLVAHLLPGSNLAWKGELEEIAAEVAPPSPFLRGDAESFIAHLGTVVGRAGPVLLGATAIVASLGTLAELAILRVASPGAPSTIAFLVALYWLYVASLVVFSRALDEESPRLVDVLLAGFKSKRVAGLVLVGAVAPAGQWMVLAGGCAGAPLIVRLGLFAGFMLMVTLLMYRHTEMQLCSLILLRDTAATTKDVEHRAKKLVETQPAAL
jgi:hypothetical protein